VLVVEAFAPRPQSAAQPGFDARTTALSYGSREIFEHMGLWSQLNDFATPITSIQISDKGHFGSALIDHQEQRTEALGYVVENQALGNCLSGALESSGDIEFLYPAQIAGIRPTPEGMALAVQTEDDTHAVAARLVVLADGGKSPICANLGITHKTTHYEQSALIANIAFEKPHQNMAFERFTDTGPLAVLPLSDSEEQHRGSLVWTVTAQQAIEFQTLSEPELLQRLTARFGTRLGTLHHIGKRYCYPLSLSVANEQIRPGLVLLGNVAHTLHPVAGQGLNLALRDARELVQTLLAGIAQQQSPGDMTVLQRYLDRQQSDQDRAIGFTDWASRLFSSNNRAKVLARKAGLLAFDLIPPVRREFARHAMGLATER
jgi:2-polyprenyl-6-methoxyphenol 4-hydroxylase